MGIDPTLRPATMNNPYRSSFREKDTPVAWYLVWPCLAFGTLALCLQWFLSEHPSWVERYYSRGVYPVIAKGLGLLTGWTSYSVGEILLLLFAGWILWRAVRGLIEIFQKKRTLRNMLAHAFGQMLGAAGILYGLFVLLWGLNYHRTPLRVKLNFDLRAAHIDELEKLAVDLVHQANRLRAKLPEEITLEEKADFWERTREGFAAAAASYPDLDLDLGFGQPKKTILAHKMFSYLGIGGLFCLLTSEPLVNSDVPAPSRLFSACHEAAHRFGYAREEEANFIAYLVCRAHPDLDFHYSGDFEAMRHTLRAIYRTDPNLWTRIAAGQSKIVRRDLQSIHDFWAQYELPELPLVELSLDEIADKVNDLYLKSQGQEKGVLSYGLMVDLLLAERRN